MEELYKLSFDGTSVEVDIDPEIFKILNEADKEQLDKCTREILEVVKGAINRND